MIATDGQSVGRAASPLSAGFEPVAASLRSAARAGEVIFMQWRAESSDFVRFNDARIRQAGTVGRCGAELRLIDGGRVAQAQLTLAGDARVDVGHLRQTLDMLRTVVAQSPVDPWLIFDDRPAQSFECSEAALPSPDELGGVIRQAAGDADLVGFWMAGPMAIGLASSLGHRHYHEAPGWSFDFSIYARRDDVRDKAIKSSVAGTDWQPDRVAASIARARAQLPLLEQPVRRLAPGRYRAWLAPRAAADLLGMLNWGGFSGRAQQTGQSPLARLQRDERRFDPRVNLTEDLVLARAPRFQSDGFVRPGQVALVRDGRFAGALVSPRTAREFSIPSNGATGSEGAQSLVLAPGSLADDDALTALGTGLAVSNLWYLNFSDRAAGRVTGMTRFATLWVEDGRPVAPVEVMRFDDSLYELLGDRLEALGAAGHWLPDTDSYDWRAFGGVSTPALLVGGMDFTL